MKWPLSVYLLWPVLECSFCVQYIINLHILNENIYSTLLREWKHCLVTIIYSKTNKVFWTQLLKQNFQISNDVFFLTQTAHFYNSILTFVLLILYSLLFLLSSFLCTSRHIIYVYYTVQYTVFHHYLVMSLYSCISLYSNICVDYYSTVLKSKITK